MELISGLVAIGGLLIAALSVYLSYRSRIQTFGESLYEIQIRGASEVIDNLVEVNQSIDRFRIDTNIGILESDEDFKQFRTAIYDPKEKLRATILKYSPFMPSSVFLTLSEYLAQLELVLGEMRTHEAYHTIGRYEQIHDPWDIIIANFALSILSIRDFLGVGPISKSILKTVGKPKDSDSEETKEKIRELVRLLQREYDWPTSQMLGVDKDVL